MAACRRAPGLHYALVAALTGALALLVGGVAGGDAAAGGNSSVQLATCVPLDTAPAGHTAPSADPLALNAPWTFFPSRASLRYASWRIHYYPTFKIVENTFDGRQYMLAMRGAQVPALAPGQVLPLPAADPTAPGANQSQLVVSANMRNFTVPVRRVCVEETVSLAFVELLGLRDKITVMSSAPTSPCAAQMNLTSLEPTYGNLTIRQQQVGRYCDLVLGGNGAGPANELQYVSFAVTKETDLLARAEWLMFVAAFFNREAAATAIFSGIQSRYAATVANVTAQRAANPTTQPPVVAWLSVWAGTYTVSVAAYKLNATRDAGGQIWAPAVKSYSNATVLAQAMQAANVWAVVDETYAPNPPAYNLSTFLSGFGLPATNVSGEWAPYAFLSRTQVYRYDGLISQANLALDWFEDALPNADALLADLASLLAQAYPRPAAALQTSSRLWFRNIATGDAPRYTPTTCASASAPSLPVAVQVGQAAREAVSACPLLLQQPWPADSTDSTGTASPRSTVHIFLLVALAALMLGAA